MTHNTREVEEVKQIARYIVQVVVDNWPEYHLMTGRERNRLFDGIKPIIHHQLQKAREEERERCLKAIEEDRNESAHEGTDWANGYRAGLFMAKHYILTLDNQIINKNSNDNRKKMGDAK